MSECAFDGCGVTDTRRVVLTAGAAARWSLRPALLASVERVVLHDGAAEAVGLALCAAHVVQAVPRVGGERPPGQRALLDYMAERTGLGGIIIAEAATALGYADTTVKTLLGALERDGVVEKTNRRRRTRAGRLATVYRLRPTAPPAVQPVLLPAEGESP